MGERLADNLGRAHAEHVEEAGVGEHDVLAMHQHCIVHRLDQTLEQLLAVLETRAAPIEIVEQLIDGAPELRQRRRVILDADAAHRQIRVGECLQLLGEIGDRPFLAALPAQEHAHAHRGDS